MFSIVCFKKVKKKKGILKFTPFSPPVKAIKEQYEGAFGQINVYTVFYYKNKEKAFAALCKQCNQKPFTKDSKPPSEYLKELYCEQLIAKSQRKDNLTLFYVPEKQTLIKLVRKFKTVYITEVLDTNLANEIWKECGALPVFCKFPPKGDHTATGNETPTVKELPEPFSDICPQDFPPTLFAGLLYKENGIFIS